MGMSASQARLLTLTSRLSDLEFQAQTISNSKLRLSAQSEAISKAYSDALNVKKFTYLDSATNTYRDLTYDSLTGADMGLGAQYGLSDSSGNLLVTAFQADAFKNASNITDFLENTGVTSTTYPGYNSKADYLAALAKAQTDYTTAKTALSNFATGKTNGGIKVEGYDDSTGTWSYSRQEAKTQYSASANVWGDPHYDIVGSKGNSYRLDHKGVSGATYNLFEGDNLKVYSTYGSPNNGYCVITSSHITTGKSTVAYNSNGTATITTEDASGNLVTKTLARGSNADLGDGSGSRYSYNGSSLTIVAADGTGCVSFSGTTVTVGGAFAELDGIVGDGVTDSTSSVAAADAAMVDSNAADGITINGTDVNAKYYDWSALKTVNYNSTDNPDKVSFLDPNGNPITDANQLAGLVATWNKLSNTFKAAEAILNALVALPVVAAGPNADDKVYYTNLYTRMQSGYKQLADESIVNNADWLETQLTNGNLMMEKCVNGKWQTTSWSSSSQITQETDDTAVAKAEADYKIATSQIESKDNRYDLELKNIDTEHSAIQTEMESVKKVIDKNIERTFKVFDA